MSGSRGRGPLSQTQAQHHLPDKNSMPLRSPVANCSIEAVRYTRRPKDCNALKESVREEQAAHAFFFKE